ncbi:MAG: DUF819 family protein [Candidatus Omnitrophica bacterium]|nr:DUF819 family protein [Candidatus Omnitrophota bacterium]
MIHHPAAIFILLVLLEWMILVAADHPKTKSFFRFIPAVFWIYFIPMLLASSSLIDNKSPLYGVVTQYGLPMSLFLLLLGVDLKSITKLGRIGILMFLAGSFGVMLGSTISFALFQHIVGPEFYAGFGALSASWTGGSANMIAVKEALGTPDDIYLPMVVVDTVVPYVWMGLLIMVSPWQEAIDRFNKADRTILDAMREKIEHLKSTQIVTLTIPNIIILILLGFGVSCILGWLSNLMPVIPGMISSFTWMIIFVSVAGLGCSLTKLHHCESMGSSKIGYVLLYFVLMTIGAKASMAYLGNSVVLIFAGFLIVIIHAIVLLFVTRLLKAPVMLAAASSQANLGGVASAPVVAEIYQPGLSTIGLLMAIFGNVIGTYLGILVGQICHRIN